MSSSHKCRRCGKTVYATEEMRAGDMYFHKGCFKCMDESCGITLTMSNFLIYKDGIYCKKHVPKPKHTQAEPEIQKISPGSSLQPPSSSRPRTPHK
jgi:hypothetical protein